MWVGVYYVTSLVWCEPPLILHSAHNHMVTDCTHVNTGKLMVSDCLLVCVCQLRDSQVVSREYYDCSQFVTDIIQLGPDNCCHEGLNWNIIIWSFWDNLEKCVLLTLSFYFFSTELNTDFDYTQNLTYKFSIWSVTLVCQLFLGFKRTEWLVYQYQHSIDNFLFRHNKQTLEIDPEQSAWTLILLCFNLFCVYGLCILNGLYDNGPYHCTEWRVTMEYSGLPTSATFWSK